MLAGLGVISYFFVIRGLYHTHQLPAKAAMQPVEGSLPGEEPTLTGKTLLDPNAGRVARHQHVVTLDPSGGMEVATEHEHTHSPRFREVDRCHKYHEMHLSGPDGRGLVARVPIIGTLSFSIARAVLQKRHQRRQGGSKSELYRRRHFVCGDWKFSRWITNVSLPRPACPSP